MELPNALYLRDGGISPIILTPAKEAHPLNAPMPIIVTVLGISISEASEVQSLKT